MDIITRLQSTTAAATATATTAAAGAAAGAAGGKRARPFDTMNNMIAHTLINLTASARFGGSLNVDINEVCCFCFHVALRCLSRASILHV